MSCSGDAPEAGSLHPWRVAASYGLVWTRLQFDGHINGDLFQRAAVVALSRRLGDRITVLGSAGATLDGSIDLAAGGSARLQPSFVVSAGATWQVLDSKGWQPFVTLTGLLSASSAPTTNGESGESARYTSLDIKAIAVVGYTFWHRVSPYLGASLFGGPIFWQIGHQAVVGTDRSHYQLLAGVSVALPSDLDLFVEGSPLGERALSGGLGVRF